MFFSDQLYCKNLRANTTISFRPLWDFTCVLKEVTVFIQVNLESCLLQLYNNNNYLTNKTNIDLYSKYRLTNIDRLSQKKSEHNMFSQKPLWWSLVWQSHMVMLFSKHFERTLTLKITRKNSALKFLFGNAACNFMVFTIEAFTILAISFLLINMINS